MKVLAITNLFPNAREPDRGVFKLQQYTALSRYAPIRVVAPIAWRPWAHDPRPPVSYEESWNGIPTVHPFYFYTPGVGRGAYSLWMYLSLRRAVLRIAREYRPDVLLGAWAYPDAVATAMLARRLRLPWVAQVLGSDINVLAAAPLVRKQIRWALRQAFRTLSVSHPLKDKLLEIGIPGEAVRVLHNGVDTQRFRLQDQSAARRRTRLPLDRRIVVYVGNLKASKGVLDLLEAVRLLAADPARAPLIVLVGEGPDRNRIEEQIEESRLQEHVMLAGPRPHAKIPDWMAAADALCLPSHGEGCPNVVLEGLACGRPVVATRVGAVPDFVDQHSGALVAPQQPRQLAEALQAVARRDWDAGALRKRVEMLSWEDNALFLARELQEAANSCRSAPAAGSELPPVVQRAPEPRP